MKKFLKVAAYTAGIAFLGAALVSWLVEDTKNESEGEEK